MSESRFYFCEKCGNTVGMIHDMGVPLYCCGVEMKHLDPKAGNKDGVCMAKNNDGVSVDIQKMTTSQNTAPGWVYLQTDRGGQRKCVGKADKANVRFTLCDESPKALYSFNNEQGLWRVEL